MNKTTLIVTFIIFSISCQPPERSERKVYAVPEEAKDPDKIYNLMDEELPEKVLSEKQQALFESNLEDARQSYTSTPDSLEAIIWYGRRLAYLGRYLEAIKVYSDGLRIFPDSYRLYRHRGHRYITTRQLEKAIKDYELAAYYSRGTENQIEPDGLPNKLNQPLSNDQFNIWYHFGLAYYLSGRYDKALSAYNKCQEVSDNDDLKVATTYWQYLTYKKLGNNELASASLNGVSSQMQLIENTDYHDLLLLFKGEKNGEELIQSATKKDGMINPTLAYGIASNYQHTGELDKANELFLRTIESPQWDAFGYIAAEAELKTIFPVP